MFLRLELRAKYNFVVKVRQICHIALKKDHEYVNTVEEGSEETHAKVDQAVTLFTGSIVDIISLKIVYASGDANSSSCSFGKALSASVCFIERTHCK